ncbi:MAG: cbb3-type cytochrome c oxidase subunit [Myxococcaceae bacterium]|nr:cbb3-type cytochrome c oxidase subunit [Myxococcaceae bacterium]
MGEKKANRCRWALLAVAAVSGIACTRSEPEPPLPPLTNELLIAAGNDPAVLAEGKQLFTTACIACHGPEGQGLVGPNLTDSAWINGSAPVTIHRSISKGNPDKGMVPFENLLGDRQVRKVTAFVLSLKGKNLPGKPPEGKVD